MAAEVGRRSAAAETVAGYLATIAIAAGAIALVYRPVRIAPAAIVVALVAAAIGGRHERLAALSVVVAGTGFLVGMVIAVLVNRPLF